MKITITFGIELPPTIEGVMESFKNNPEFDFYKSLEIDNINAEILALHPSEHVFLPKNAAKNSLRKVPGRWLSHPTRQFYTKEGR